MPDKKDDTPQFEKDAKATRDSVVANLLLGKRGGAEAATIGSANKNNDEARKAAGMKRGGQVQNRPGRFAKGGTVDGIAQRGKTRGKLC